MRALTLTPMVADSLAVSDVPDPRPGPADLLVDGLAVGVCGTDRELAQGLYGWAPPRRERLVIGHESLGRVREAPPGSGFTRGDLVVGVVRRPDPEPCGACAHGQFDMCRNGRYTERGIKEIDGYASTAWTVETGYAVRLDRGLERVGVLMEPASVGARAWDQVERIGERACFAPRTVVVTGAGPIGLLAALLGVQRGLSVQRRLDVHVLDQATDGPKPRLVADLGATYHSDGFDDLLTHVQPDIVIEATGVDSLVLDAIEATRSYGVVRLTGISNAGRTIAFDASAANREIVLENDVVFGSVNANLHHYALAADALAAADAHWLARLVTRRVPLEHFAEAFTQEPDDVKVVLTLDGST